MATEGNAQPPGPSTAEDRIPSESGPAVEPQAGLLAPWGLPFTRASYDSYQFTSHCLLEVHLQRRAIKRISQQREFQKTACLVTGFGISIIVLQFTALAHQGELRDRGSYMDFLLSAVYVKVMQQEIKHTSLKSSSSSTGLVWGMWIRSSSLGPNHTVTLYADSTFSIAAPLSMQMYVLLAKRGGFVYLVQYTVLPNKQERAYIWTYAD
ncbi:hypothetical protein M514_08583 [Trichuris suis]|uniref:Uncharacterized protein n=1 Tax=Trichuris suis TaxID=68888 RepID=A0A085LZW9_9BILA|nr:hypothetical protein M513_08583 [Trichuris suis]KFD63462.1 hypothetical protein M514_08583 [Trichuris suis]